MSQETSFTLCPSHGGAFSSYPHPTGHSGGEMRPGRKPERTPPPNLFVNTNYVSVYPPPRPPPPPYAPHPAYAAPYPPQRVIPGTILQDWTISNRPRRFASGRAIQASPFEPLAHLRNLPKDGTISPLRVNEYLAARKANPSFDNSKKPPVTEIRIPTPSQPGDAVDDNDDDHSTIPPQEKDYKTMYFESQHELHTTTEKLAETKEEVRILKREMFELQRRLLNDQRNKRPAVVNNTMWTIPDNRKQQALNAAPAPRPRPEQTESGGIAAAVKRRRKKR